MLKNLFMETRNILENLWFENEEKCLLCGKKETTVCSNCRNTYFLPEMKRCKGCGKLSSEGEICQDCAAGKGPVGLSGVTTIGHYRGAWKDYIHTVKYMAQPYLLVPLADYLATWAMEHLPPPDCAVPVPMHPKRLAERGFNQSEVLASILSRKLGINYKEILLRAADTLPQTSLGRSERIENLYGAFVFKTGASIDGQVVWLVDDVITTGATIGECARILRKGGAKEVFALSLGAGREEL